MSQRPAARAPCPLCQGCRGSLVTLGRLVRGLAFLVPLALFMVPSGSAQFVDSAGRGPLRPLQLRAAASDRKDAVHTPREVTADFPPCTYSPPLPPPLPLQALPELQARIAEQLETLETSHEPSYEAGYEASQEARAAALGHRRGYYGGGQDVGYGGSYFPIGFDPLTILAGLAFLAFIIQTLYLLLYKHYGGLGVSAGVGVGPLSNDRHQRHEEWANHVVSRIASTADTYGDNSTREDIADGVAQSRIDEDISGDEDDDEETRQLSISPLEALLSLLRRSWAARSCGSSWLCRLVHFVRLLTEPAHRARAQRDSAHQSGLQTH